MNKNKCSLILMNCWDTVRFANGLEIKAATKAEHLGGQITKKVSRTTEINNRLGKAVRVACRLNTFWGKTKAETIWKLRVFNAIVLSMLTYGLETMHLTDTMCRQLDAFHVRGLRAILNIEHSNKD